MKKQLYIEQKDSIIQLDDITVDRVFIDIQLSVNHDLQRDVIHACPSLFAGEELSMIRIRRLVENRTNDREELINKLHKIIKQLYS